MTRLEEIRRRWASGSPGPCQGHAREDVAYLLSLLPERTPEDQEREQAIRERWAEHRLAEYDDIPWLLDRLTEERERRVVAETESDWLLGRLKEVRTAAAVVISHLTDHGEISTQAAMGLDYALRALQGER